MFALVANAVKKSTFSTAKTAPVSNLENKAERGVVSMLKDGIVTILHLKKLKAGEIVGKQKRLESHEKMIPFLCEIINVINAKRWHC